MNRPLEDFRLPVRIEHENARLAEITLVDWTLGNSCNYACSYCPASLHDGTVPWPDVGRVILFCDRLIAHYSVLGRSLVFQFSGGEPTVYPGFLSLIEHLRARECGVGVISNGSRTLRWWGEARGCLDQAVLTHHVEFVKLEHFIEVARFLGKAIRTHVNVTMVPERFDECLENARRIAQECEEITLTLKPLLVDFGAVPVGYSELQREVIAKTRIAVRRGRPIAETRGTMRVMFEGGDEELCKAAELIVSGRNRFKGWACNAGVELLAIDSAGGIYRGLCRQGGKIGNVEDEEL